MNKSSPGTLQLGADHTDTGAKMILATLLDDLGQRGSADLYEQVIAGYTSQLGGTTRIHCVQK